MRHFAPLILVCLILALVGFAVPLVAQESGDRKIDAATTTPGQSADDVQDLIVFTDARPLFVRMHVTIDGRPFRLVWRDFLIKVFGELDQNLDGVLNKEEASRVPELDSVDLRFRVANPRATVSSPVADVAGNVTREAFLAHFEKTDGAPFTTRIGQGRSQFSTALFALLDTNHDQRLSADELRGAEASLRRRDYDDDEIITDQEILPGQNGLGGAIVIDRAMDGITGRSPFVFVIMPSGPTTEVADALLARYDTNKDGMLSVAVGDSSELRQDADSLAHLDLDGDRSLSRDELGRFASRLPDLELSHAVQPGNAGDKLAAVAPDGAPAFALSPTTLPDGNLMVDAGDARLEFRRVDTRNAAVVRQVSIGQIPFQALDRDNNGYIDDREAGQTQFIVGVFKAMDRDGDGKIFKEEFEAYYQRQNAAAATRVSLEVTDEGQQLLELIDKDRDGRLTLRELRTAAELLEKSDTDHDGSLAGSEIPRRLRLELARGTAANNPFARQVIAAGGMRSQPARSNTTSTGPSWFRRMDRNRDGDLSPREFLGPREDFDRLDANHDGLIDAKEAEASANN